MKKIENSIKKSSKKKLKNEESQNGPFTYVKFLQEKKENIIEISGEHNNEMFYDKNDYLNYDIVYRKLE